MTLMGLTGALMGVAASVAGRIGKRAEDQRVAQLENHVEHLESRLRVAESLLDHWRSEARRLAHDERVRERAWIEAQSFAQAAQYQAQQAILPQNPQAALQQAMQAQHYPAMVPSDLGQGQLGQQQQALAQIGMPRSAAALREAQFSIIRNCSPGRAAVLGGTHGLFENLDPGEA